MSPEEIRLHQRDQAVVAALQKMAKELGEINATLKSLQEEVRRLASKAR